MTKTPSEQRIAVIEEVEADCARLLAAGLHQSLEEHVRLGIRDLKDARQWLKVENIDGRPHMMAIVDAAIYLATLHLNTVDRAIRSHGPGAALI